REHPLAAHEERGLDAVRAQKIDDATLIAGDFGRLLAKIECEGDELLIACQRDAADDVALRGGGSMRRARVAAGQYAPRPSASAHRPCGRRVRWASSRPAPSPPRHSR